MNYNYRPDIDGLRAISVLLVLFFHAGLFGIKAGFVGVDVFFVISGFLITTGIKNGLEKGNFSFVEFFKRRLWRLQPVFISLLLVTIIMTSITYLPDDYLGFTKSARWAARFQANKYFSDLNSGYFADDVSIMPLLHTWSLSIEWQWYLLLPFLMFGFYQILKIKKMAFWVFPLTIIAIVVPFYCIEDKNNSDYYYSFSSRIFEMLIGSCLAAVGSKGSNKIPSILKSLIGVVCLGIVIYAGFSERIIQSYPNWWAVAVCISAALLIYIGNSKNLITKILSWKPLVFIGVLSYSLYIWHWPVFAFVRNLAIEETTITISIALALSFILATLSYYLIENKFRKKHTTSLLKSLLILVIVPYLAISILDSINTKNKGYPNRFDEAYKNIYAIDKEFSIQYRDKIYCNGIKDKNNKNNTNYICTFNKENNNKSIYFIGDSYADHSWQFMKVLADDANSSLKMQVTAGNFAILDVYQNIDHLNLKNDQFRHEFTKSIYQEIEKKHYNYVVVGQVWTRYITNTLRFSLVRNKNNTVSVEESKAAIKFGLDKSLAAIIKVGSTPVILINTYDASEFNDYYLDQTDKSKCALTNLKIHNIINNKCDFDSNTEKDSTRKWINELFFKMKEKYPELILIDMYSLQCQNELCKTEINNYPIYRDGHGHITEYASYQFGKDYIKQYGNPFK